MDQVSNDRTRAGADRRQRMRDEARAQGAVRYQTPQWLERSFVLPVSGPSATPEVPAQGLPEHDDLAAPTDLPLMPPETKVPRLQAAEIDFARVIQRRDLSRRASHIAWATAGLTGVALILCLVMPTAALIAVVVGFAALCLVALTASLQLSHAPVPRVDRHP